MSPSESESQLTSGALFSPSSVITAGPDGEVYYPDNYDPSEPQAGYLGTFGEQPPADDDRVAKPHNTRQAQIGPESHSPVDSSFPRPPDSDIASEGQGRDHSRDGDPRFLPETKADHPSGYSPSGLAFDGPPSSDDARNSEWYGSRQISSNPDGWPHGPGKSLADHELYPSPDPSSPPPQDRHTSSATPGSDYGPAVRRYGAADNRVGPGGNAATDIVFDRPPSSDAIGAPQPGDGVQYQERSSSRQTTAGPDGQPAGAYAPNKPFVFTTDMLIAIPSDSATGSISGKVFKADGTTAIANAQVWARKLDGSGCCWGANTASDGSYTIVTPGSGIHAVLADARSLGYVLESYNNKPYPAADPVSVTAPNDTPNINFTLDLGGTISGRVFTADGTTPIANASVQAELTNGACCGNATVTASDGSYAIKGLSTGNYRVLADARNQGYLLEYYNNKAASVTADAVAVTAPNTTPNINFTLELGGTISGKIFKADGTTPIAGASMVARKADGSDCCYYGTTGSDGAYAIIGLSSGDWRVSADARSLGYVYQYYNDKPSSSTADIVAVTAGQTTPNINFTLDLGGTISGKVLKADGTTPIANAYVRAERVDGQCCSSSSARTGADGSYIMNSLSSGSYRMYADARDQGYIFEFYDGKATSSTADAVAVTAPDDTPNINFTLDLGGTISGKVTKADGTTPIANAYVRAEKTDGSQCCFDAQTSSDGSYTIRSLTSGSYRVFANARDQGYIFEYYNGKATSSAADPVAVTAPDDTPNINFTLDLGGTISGKVFKADGTTPIVNAQIRAEKADGTWCCAWGQSGDDGAYSIIGLATGSYRMFADARDQGYIFEYYNGKATSSTADPVAVTAPDDTPNINFTLDLGGTISGKVFKADGTTPIANAQVRAEKADGTWCCAWGQSGDDGAYSIIGLATGSYRLFADARDQGYVLEYYNNKAHSGILTPCRSPPGRLPQASTSPWNWAGPFPAR